MSTGAPAKQVKPPVRRGRPRKLRGIHKMQMFGVNDADSGTVKGTGSMGLMKKVALIALGALAVLIAVRAFGDGPIALSFILLVVQVLLVGVGVFLWKGRM
jgi:hypothetical protein